LREEADERSTRPVPSDRRSKGSGRLESSNRPIESRRRRGDGREVYGADFT
jgi:hypothetical protein